MSSCPANQVRERIAASVRRIERTARAARAGLKEAQVEHGLLVRLKAALDGGRPARFVPVQNGDEARVLRELHLITTKPVMYLANTDESRVADLARLELAEMDDHERQGFRSDQGLMQSGLERVITSGNHLLVLDSFLTAGEQESSDANLSGRRRAPSWQRRFLSWKSRFRGR